MALTSTTRTTTGEEARICEAGYAGTTILPIYRDDEVTWGWTRLPLYLLGLGYLFMGVAVVADVFMGAIEAITSEKKRKLNPKTQHFVTVKVWNPTVANLTLMALGSSAPEILLAVIELMQSEFFSGALGPSTIVGSAAFNLLCIIAVCIMAIPEGEFRKIKEMPVYCVTAFFSIFAYLWVMIILVGSSPNIIEIWEGLITLLMFPVLVILAFAADKGYLGGGVKDRDRSRVISADTTKEELAKLALEVRAKHGSDLTDQQVTKLIALEHAAIPTRAAYRVQAIRKATGGRKVHLQDRSHNPEVDPEKVVPVDDIRRSQVGPKETVLEFESSSFAVLENAGHIKLEVIRDGETNCVAKVEYKTRAGTAEEDSDFKPQSGTLTFGVGETSKIITIQIVDDENYEEDEYFYVDLFAVDGFGKIGQNAVATVTIIDDDLPGTLGFEKDKYDVYEQVDDFEVEIKVVRTGGSTGQVTCKYCTEDDSALKDMDYNEAKGTLTFPEGILEQTIKVGIIARGRYDSRQSLRILLTEPTNGAKFDETLDGGEEQAITYIFIESDQKAKEKIDHIMSALQINWDKAQIGHANWAAQFSDALYPGGGDDDDDDDEDGDEEEGEKAIAWPDIIMHCIMLPWKLIFAFIPPVDYCKGWACFVCALMGIGAVTFFIADMANLVGCVLNIESELVAITFVALGTSLPDTFASKMAAEMDPYADSSVGNVTGSNSVNVFLGLGVPWTLGAIYWTAMGANDEWTAKYETEDWAADWLDGALVVPAGNLVFSVIVFTCCALSCLALLYVRRLTCQGELGGPVLAKKLSAAFLVFLWFTYVGLSAWYTTAQKND